MIDSYFKNLVSQINQLNNTEDLGLFSQNLFSKLDLFTKYLYFLRRKFKLNSQNFRDLNKIINSLYVFQLEYYLLLKTKGVDIKISKSNKLIIDNHGLIKVNSKNNNVLTIKTLS